MFGATNDFRGLLETDGPTGGWHLSLDGGRSVANEGLLPSVAIGGLTASAAGDPVAVAAAGCRLYAANLAFSTEGFPPAASGIAVYRSTPQVASSCPGGLDPACWPVRRVVAANASPDRLLDKEWMDVGRSGSAGEVVWVTYSDFDLSAATEEESLGDIMAVRCDASLSSCTAPMRLSAPGEDSLFSDVTIGADGRVYVSWLQILGLVNPNPTGDGQAFVLKVRVAEPGQTSFGPTRVIATEPLAIPVGGVLAGSDFRITSYPKIAQANTAQGSRLFMVWDACGYRVLNEEVFETPPVCEKTVVKVTYSDNLGRTWSPVRVISVGGNNYFPTIDADPSSSSVAVAWYTTRFDPMFDNSQDVELVRLEANSGELTSRQRVTSTSSEPEGDPIFGGYFIGDYFEVSAQSGDAYVHYNASYRRVPFVGDGFPIPQADNFLSRRRL